MVYADFAQGFRDGGSNSGFSDQCYADGVPQSYVPDTLNNYELGWKTTSLNGRLLWNGAAYLMDWKKLQTIIYDVDICPSSSFYVNVGDARIYGVESNIDFKVNDNWSLQAAASYTDSHLISSPYDTFKPNVGERLPYVPYFSWSWNVRYEHPLGANLRGYAQFDMSHKGDMWNDLHVEGSNGDPARAAAGLLAHEPALRPQPRRRPLAGGAVHQQSGRQERRHLHQHRQFRHPADDQPAAHLRAARELPLRQGNQLRVTSRGRAPRYGGREHRFAAAFPLH